MVVPFPPPDKYAAQAMVQYLVEDLKLTKIGIIHDSDALALAGRTLWSKR